MSRPNQPPGRGRERRGPRGLWAKVSAVSIGVALVAGCAVADASSPRPPSSKPRVTVVGDSLTVLGHDQITSALDPGWLVTIDAFPGRTTGTQLAELAFAARRDEAATIISLGTNDALGVAYGRLSLDQARADISSALDLFGDRCVVWVIPDRDPERHGVGAGAEIDSLVRSQAAGRPNVHIADLAAVLGDHPEYFATDHVHLTADGYRALARLMAETVATCR